MGRSSGLRHGSSKLYTFSWPWHGGHILGSVHQLTRVRQEAWKGTVLTTKGRGSPPKDSFRGSGSGVGSIAGARLQRAGDAGLLGPVRPLAKVRGQQSLQSPELHQATPSPNLFWSSPCMFGEFLVARRKNTTSFFELRIWDPWIRSRRPGQTPGLELGAPERGAAAPRGLGQGERACRWGVWVPLYISLVLLLFFRKRQHRRKPKGDRAARKGFCSSRGLDVR